MGVWRTDRIFNQNRIIADQAHLDIVGLDNQKFSAKIVNIFFPIIFSICFGCSFLVNKKQISYSVILLPAHPASFAHNFVSWMHFFLFQRVPGCNSIADLSLEKVFLTHMFAVGTH